MFGVPVSTGAPALITEGEGYQVSSSQGHPLCILSQVQLLIKWLHRFLEGHDSSITVRVLISVRLFDMKINNR